MEKGKRLLVLCFFCLCSFSSVFAVKNITFSVVLSRLAIPFDPAKDQVYIRGTFNNWQTTSLLAAIGNMVYAVTLPLAEDTWFEYKFYVTTSGILNDGWENSFPVTTSGNRRIYIGVNDLKLPTLVFDDGEMDRFRNTDHFNIMSPLRKALFLIQSPKSYYVARIAESVQESERHSFVRFSKGY